MDGCESDAFITRFQSTQEPFCFLFMDLACAKSTTVSLDFIVMTQLSWSHVSGQEPEQEPLSSPEGRTLYVLRPCSPLSPHKDTAAAILSYSGDKRDYPAMACSWLCNSDRGPFTAPFFPWSSGSEQLRPLMWTSRHSSALCRSKQARHTDPEAERWR